MFLLSQNDENQSENGSKNSKIRLRARPPAEPQKKMLQTKKLKSKSWKTRVFFTFRLPILDGRVHEQVSSVLFFTVFFEGERHDLSKTGGFGRKMPPPPPGKPVTFYECHPEDHAPAPSVRADFHLFPSMYIYFLLFPSIYFPSMSIYVHLLPSISVYVHLCPSTSFYFHLFPSMSIYVHLLPSISIYIFPSMFIYVHLLPSISIYFRLCPSISYFPAQWPRWDIDSVMQVVTEWARDASDPWKSRLLFCSVQILMDPNGRI